MFLYNKAQDALIRRLASESLQHFKKRSWKWITQEFANNADGFAITQAAIRNRYGRMMEGDNLRLHGIPKKSKIRRTRSVSYTHLTLPTICSV